MPKRNAPDGGFARDSGPWVKRIKREWAAAYRPRGLEFKNRELAITIFQLINDYRADMGVTPPLFWDPMVHERLTSNCMKLWVAHGKRENVQGFWFNIPLVNRNKMVSFRLK